MLADRSVFGASDLARVAAERGELSFERRAYRDLTPSEARMDVRRSRPNLRLVQPGRVGKILVVAQLDPRRMGARRRRRALQKQMISVPAEAERSDDAHRPRQLEHFAKPPLELRRSRKILAVARCEQPVACGRGPQGGFWQLQVSEAGAARLDERQVFVPPHAGHMLTIRVEPAVHVVGAPENRGDSDGCREDAEEKGTADGQRRVIWMGGQDHRPPRRHLRANRPCGHGLVSLDALGAAPAEGELGASPEPRAQDEP